MTDTLLLRAVAALLIANSHIESFYPVRQLAADGLLGDTLFFFLSGYGLALSARKGQRGFLEWYGRRISRIYPALIVTVIVFDCLLNGGWQTWSVSDYLLSMGWGRAYPFVGQILIFYVAFYVLTLVRRPEVYLLTLTTLFLPYFTLPMMGRGEGDIVFHAFHWLFYFQAMLLGGWVAERPSVAAPATRRDLALLGGLGLLYLASRIGVSAGPLRRWYFLPHILVLPIIVLLLRMARSRTLNEGLARWPVAARALAFLGGITLEVYLIHYQVLRMEWVRALVTPLNIVVFFVISIASAAVLSRFVRSLTELRVTPRWLALRAPTRVTEAKGTSRATLDFTWPPR